MSEIFDPQAETYRKTYGANLERAQREGLIIGPSEDYKYRTEGSHYSHLPWAIGDSRQGILFKDNTRPLSQSAKILIAHYARQGNFRYLEMGPGAGKSVYDVHKISRDAGVRADIDTVSFDPIDPYSVLTMTVFEIREKLKKFLQDGTLTSTEEKQKFLLESKVDETGDPSFDLDFLLHLQEKFGIKIFEALGEPFVQRQYIGRFPTDVQLEPGRYDFIYEECGPLHYREEISASQVYRSTYRALSEKGIMYFSPGILQSETVSGSIFDFLEDGDLAVANVDFDSLSAFDPENPKSQELTFYGKPTLIARRKSVVAKMLKPKLEGEWKLHNEVFVTGNLQRLITEIFST